MEFAARFDITQQGYRHGTFAANHPGTKPGGPIILDGIEQILRAGALRSEYAW
jgi:hypothetical protein